MAFETLKQIRQFTVNDRQQNVSLKWWNVYDLHVFFYQGLLISTFNFEGCKSSGWDHKTFKQPQTG